MKMKNAQLSTLLLAALLGASTAQAGALDELFAGYKGQGARSFDARAGAALWRQKFSAADGKKRACTSCHGDDLTRPGRHATTGKTIEPLAPSANSKRLRDRREIVKWLKRNCKWTLGRTCNPQEKGDLLSFLRTQ